MIYLEEYLRALEIMRLVLGCPTWDIRVCFSRNLHRKYWKYDGNGRFSCEICLKLARIAC